MRSSRARRHPLAIDPATIARFARINAQQARPPGPRGRPGARSAPPGRRSLASPGRASRRRSGRGSRRARSPQVPGPGPTARGQVDPRPSRSESGDDGDQSHRRGAGGQVQADPVERVARLGQPIRGRRQRVEERPDDLGEVGLAGLGEVEDVPGRQPRDDRQDQPGARRSPSSPEHPGNPPVLPTSSRRTPPSWSRSSPVAPEPRGLSGRAESGNPRSDRARSGRSIRPPGSGRSRGGAR